MKILTRYILKEMIGPTLLGFAFYTSIILMQRLFDMAGMIIRKSLPAEDVFNLLLLALPNIVVLTVPMSLLFGILIAVGRLSADSEIIAMRALGMSMRQIYVPVFLFSLALFFVNLYLINVIMPRGNTKLQALRAEIVTSSVEKEIKPRVFYDEYEGVMIYIDEVDPSGQWKGVFVADTRSEDAEAIHATGATQPAPPADDSGSIGGLSGGDAQRIVVARSGDLSVIKPGNEIWMNLTDARTHIWNPREQERYDLNSNKSQRILLPSMTSDFEVSRLARSLREMTLRELAEQERNLRESRDRVTYNLARVEIHKKFAIPFACIAFGVLGLPLGITNRRGGKSSGFSLSIAIILFYYLMINNGEQLAAAGRIAPSIAMWGANIVLLAVGISLLIRANRDVGAQREGGFIRRAFAALRRRAKDQPEAAAAVATGQGRRMDARGGDDPSVLNRLDITFPNILDRYILREFLKVLALVVLSVMTLFIVVDYTEIARDVRANDIRIHTLLYYYRFQIFQVMDWTLPISVLVATLVTFGMMTKNNEITAIKSNGVSLYRVALPIVTVAAIISVFAYFVRDFVLPYANQRVYELKRKIEGKPPISAAAQQRLWYHGKGRYLINFLSYEPNEKVISQVQVFEFHPTDFRLTRRVYARQAKWNGQAWAFEDGWLRSFNDDGTSTYSPITTPLALFYPETPEDFATDVKPPDQMTYAQLRRYVQNIRKSGYGADDLAVRLYVKTSWPAISIVMALIALPFAFKLGKGGALYGIFIAIVVGVVYWMLFAVFTKFGEVGNLPPLLSAWAANILFAISAVYLFLHVET